MGAAARTGGTNERRRTIAALGFGQILAWGSSYYLLAVLAAPIAQDTGWPLGAIFGGVSVGMLVAAFVSVRVGHLIEELGGRRVLAGSAVLLGTGLAILGFASSLPMFFAGWVVMGIGMGAGLYDAAFSTLGRLFGREARSAISSLTLFGGFASTICWPLSAYLVDGLGWRGACLAYAGLHLAVTLPLYLFGVPDGGRGPATAAADQEAAPDAGRRPGLVLVLAAVLTTAAFVQSAISVHLLTILQAGGTGLGAAVALGGLIGPSQVGARLLERTFGSRYHPIWTLAAATLLVATGLALLFGSAILPALAIMLYGAGVGINSIAKGAVPLALFGPGGYPVLMGKLARPVLIAQAAAPFTCGLLMERGGVEATTALLVAIAVVNSALVFALWRSFRPAPVPA